MLRQSAGRAGMLLLGGAILAGCSETGFQDLMGAGKYAPDETKVSVQQPLSVPPDLQLRPPSDAPPPPPPVVSTQPATAQPVVQGQMSQPANLAEAPAQEQSPPQTAPQPQQTAQPQQMAANQPQDPYARYGISRTHPDGREKTQYELNEELRQKKLELERQKNPNYGTIWNLGAVWGD